MNLTKHKKGEPYNVGRTCFVTFCNSGNNIVARFSSRARALIGNPRYIKVSFSPELREFSFSGCSEEEGFSVVQGRILAFQIRSALELIAGVRFNTVLGRHQLTVKGDKLILNLSDIKEPTP